MGRYVGISRGGCLAARQKPGLAGNERRAYLAAMQILAFHWSSFDPNSIEDL